MENFKEQMEELTEYLDSLQTKQQESICQAQLEILTRVFSDHKEALKTLAESGKPFVIILGSNLKNLEPILSQAFKTHVNPYLNPGQIVVFSDEWESLRKTVPSVYHHDLYALARIDASAWWNVYKSFKNKSDGDATV